MSDNNLNFAEHGLKRGALLALALVSACASQPKLAANPRHLTAISNANPDLSIALMKAQGEKFAKVPFVAGNKAEILVNGPASFAALADAINGASRRIDMETYEFDEQAGGQFADLLIAAHRRGVLVNLIYDAWGTLDTPSALFNRLKAGGVNVLEYNPLAPNSRVGISINARDHRKLLCVDGRITITGGVNITKVYENQPGADSTDPDDLAWRDTDIRIEGPVTAQFEKYYMETWHAQKGPALPAPPPPPPPYPAGYTIQAIDGAPDNGQPLIYRTLVADISLAQISVHLTTGFFAPTPDLLKALKDAARRGVDVQIIAPGQSTSDMALAAGRSTYDDLLEAGVGIHEFGGRILHAKTAVIDGGWVAIGSSNLDWRSTVWNNEIDAIVLSRRAAAAMEEVFKADIAASKSIDLASWRHRGIGERLREFQAKFLEQFL